MVQWNELKPLLVWVLYFAAIETKHSVEQRHLVMMLAVVIKAMHLHEWREVLSTLKNVLWVGKVHTSSDDLVRDRVMQIVNQECVGQPITVNTTPTRLKVAPVVFDRN
ncbi:uncharacterized protein yc1106_05281 [Curvularia clavata]|uniref:Uncharacterized protein n=1 Tax=Curvularia clavata TaxID=95742 RepID=A0A9Q9DSR6_CURCL|nr:uncharacterized protein yc1106_05281 [Curvularia clavata]